MTLQSTPPLADPLTGRIPSYTQTLQQDPVTGVWTIMYDVSNVPTQSTTGAISSMQSVQQQTQQAAQDSIEQGLTTPVETFPDYGEQTESTPFDTTPVDPQDPIFLQGGGAGGGEGQGRGDATTGPGIARSPFTGDFYSEDGTRLPDLAQQALSTFMSFTTIGQLANLNTTHDFVTRDLSVQQSIMDQERDAIMGMDVQDRAKTYGRMNRAAQRMGTTAATALGSHSGVGLQGFGNINPGVADAIGTGQEEGRSTDGPRGGAGPYSEQNRRATEAATQPTAREAARTGQYGSDSNFGGVSPGSTGTGGQTPGPQGQRGGTPSGSASSGVGGQSPGPQGQRGGAATGSASSGVGGQSPGPGGQRGGRGGGGGGSGGSGGAGGGGPAGCFVKGTMVQMANGTEKEITTIDIGDKIRGGIVQAKMEFMPQSIYNYKGVLVSGSHWVVEDNQFIEVEDSKHGILTDKVEPVYTFKTSDNRIWINNIEFGDFETGSDEDWAPYFEKVKQDLNKKLRGEA